MFRCIYINTYIYMNIDGPMRLVELKPIQANISIRKPGNILPQKSSLHFIVFTGQCPGMSQDYGAYFSKTSLNVLEMSSW